MLNQQHITIAQRFCGTSKRARWLCRRTVAKAGRPLSQVEPACTAPLDRSAAVWSAALTTCNFKDGDTLLATAKAYALDTFRTPAALTCNQH